MSSPLWSPSLARQRQSQLYHFLTDLQQQHPELKTYFDLHTWSITHPEAFWSHVATFCSLHFDTPPKQILKQGEHMLDATWFEGATLNFAQNLLPRKDEHIALHFINEQGEHQSLTYKMLYERVADFAAQLDDLGIQPGDRVAAMMPNCPETVIAMLAATSLGAVFSSCSPDFGLNGLLDRFSQITPTILIATNGHTYQNKRFCHVDKIEALIHKLPSLKHTFIFPYLDTPSTLSDDHATSLLTFTQRPAPTTFCRPLPFNHPLYILYSSGTTGKPKCIVHGAGGTLLQHKKELMLHTDLTAQDNFFFFTTCGWMMWNWLVSGLSVGATLTLYEGSPFYPTRKSLFHWIDRLNISIFGVGAKFLEVSAKSRSAPKAHGHFNSLRTILTTGSPLLPESFQYVYHQIKADVCLSSISGGSDIISCFALGNPLLPVYKGEIQCIGLGMAVDIFNEKGQPVPSEKGELVCTQPFPSMPIYFWHDPKKETYRHAYFDAFPNVWAHGDFAARTPHGGLIIFGRSDATLNPNGIRVGTAEIYQQLETIEGILEGLAIGQQYKGSERILLFVVLKPDLTLTPALTQTIKETLREHISPHHVPAKIYQVPELPRTMSGKVVELAVKKIMHHQPVDHTDALANPGSLNFFKQLANQPD